MLYAKLITLEVDEVRRFLAVHPGHIAAGNALRELERQAQGKKVLARMGRKTAPAIDPDFYHHGRPPGRSSRRCPTKRELR